MRFSEDSSIDQVYEHPAGRDIIDKLLMQTGAPAWVVLNPVVRNLRLSALKRLSFGKVDEAFLETLVNLLDAQPAQPSPATGEPKREWWKSDVIYQIYPRSFQDSNGDGIGDLKGVTSRLDYVRDLGAGAIWMSPIFDSPNDDMGYDIRDYRKIMAEFGSMEDFEELVREAHARDLKVVLDLVVNHTSDEHEWFQEALKDPESPYRDYYFFREGDGTETPPNNWESFFSGPAWNHYEDQDLWALHLFSSKQMDLNWENPKVREEVADIARFWIDKGVDGFRLDVINYISKAPGLPDGNELIGQVMGFTGVEHYFYGPKLHEHLAGLNAAAFAPSDTFSVGETPGIGTQVGKQLSDPGQPELDLIFSFDHLETPGHVRQDDYRYDLNFLKTYYEQALSELKGQYWMSLFFENHDNPRMISKVNPDPAVRGVLGKLLGGIELTLRGTPFLFQGQELGMVNQDFQSIEDLRDVEVLNAFAELAKTVGEDEAFKKLLPGTRDHARTPMQWDDSEFGGFSSATPWISGTGDHLLTNAKAEAEDPNSMLEFYRWLIHWRNEHPDFVYSPIEFLDGKVPDYWAYRRGDHLVQMNLGGSLLKVGGNLQSTELAGDATLLRSNHRHKGGVLPHTLRPYEWRLWKI